MKNKFQFEKDVIDVILNTIKKNQVYLTQKENLPQLAKLGYMYNTLWYAGRICWGYNGIIDKSNDESKEENYGQCEDNPKYKIEMCEPKNEEIENLIYDAWGMHVSNEMNTSWKEFSGIVLNGKKLSKLENKLLKPNKTFDEWVEVLTDENYEYSSIYPDRKSVASHLLCVIGNGYGYKDGFIIQEASGADQDLTLYGDWENAKFRKDIQIIVDKLLNIKEVEETVEQAYLYIKKIKDKKKDEDLKRDMKVFGMSYEDFCKKKKIKKRMAERASEYSPYYPISKGYSEITKFDEKTHKSYINAGIEICENILAHESKEETNNIIFAKSFLKKWK